MVANTTMVADMVATPHDDIVANRSERLYGVILEDEAIPTEGIFLKYRRPRTDIADEIVPFFRYLIEYFLTVFVHPAVRQQREKAESIGRIFVLDLFEGNEREPLEIVSIQLVFVVNAKGHDFVPAVVGQIKMRQGGKVVRTKYDYLGHRFSPLNT